jgi:hypothetical protein
LFHLFFSKTFLEAVWDWTNEVLVSKGKKSVSTKEFYAYKGLEMGMSSVKYNALKSYWSKGQFLGHETFKETMSRNCFMEVRSCVWLVAMQSYDGQTAIDDPLWFCRSVLDEFIRQSGRVAVPIGISAKIHVPQRQGLGQKHTVLISLPSMAFASMLWWVTNIAT